MQYLHKHSPSHPCPGTGVQKGGQATQLPKPWVQAVGPDLCPSLELLLNLQMRPIRPPLHVQTKLAQCQQSHPLALHRQPTLIPERPPLSRQAHPTETETVSLGGVHLSLEQATWEGCLQESAAALSLALWDFTRQMTGSGSRQSSEDLKRCRPQEGRGHWPL